MMHADKWKALAIAALPALAAGYVGKLVVPFFLLLGANVVDYASAITAAHVMGEAVSSRKGIAGIAKKILLWLWVVVGVLMDGMLWYTGDSFGEPALTRLSVAAMVAVWLFANELISIIENIDKAGISVPFLLPLVRWVKKGVEGKAPRPKEEEEKADGDGEEAG